MKNKIYKISILLLFVLLTKYKTEEEIIKLNFLNNCNKSLVYQIVDINKNSQTAQLLIQLNILFGKSTSVTITQNHNIKKNDFQSKVYAGFVPERKDDFVWENDRIAYGMYGQALKTTGEISNGIDVWVKSTKSLVLYK